MKKIIDKCKKWLCGKAVLNSIFIIEVIVIFGIIIFLWDDMYVWLGLHAPDGQVEKSAQFYRNRGFFIFAIAGFILTSIGMILTIWARIQANEEIKLSAEANSYKREEIANKRKEDTDNIKMPFKN